MFVESYFIIAIPGRVSPRIPELEDNFVGAFFDLCIECAEPRFLSKLIFGIPGLQDETHPLNSTGVIGGRDLARNRGSILEWKLL